MNEIVDGGAAIRFDDIGNHKLLTYSFFEALSRVEHLFIH